MVLCIIFNLGYFFKLRMDVYKDRQNSQKMTKYKPWMYLIEPYIPPPLQTYIYTFNVGVKTVIHLQAYHRTDSFWQYKSYMLRKASHQTKFVLI